MVYVCKVFSEVVKIYLNAQVCVTLLYLKQSPSVYIF